VDILALVSDFPVFFLVCQFFLHVSRLVFGPEFVVDKLLRQRKLRPKRTYLRDDLLWCPRGILFLDALINFSPETEVTTKWSFWRCWFFAKHFSLSFLYNISIVLQLYK